MDCALAAIPFVSPGTVAAVAFAVPALLLVVLHARRRALPAGTLLARVGLILVLAALLTYTLPQWNRTDLVPDGQTWNLVPLRTIRSQIAALGYDGKESIRQLAGNLLLFVPIGFLLPVAWTGTRPFCATLLAGLSVTLAVELIQLLITVTLPVWPRWADIDDVLLNTTGVVLGWIAWRFSLGRRRQRLSRAAGEGHGDDRR